MSKYEKKIVISIFFTLLLLIPTIPFVKGESFKTPNIRVDDDLGNDYFESDDPFITINRTSGDIYIVWQDNLDGDYNIYFSKSSDNGTTFGIPKQINNDGPGNNSISPKIAWDVLGIYIVWADDRNGNYDIYLSKSTNGGDSWTTNNRIDDDIGTNNSLNPAIDLNDNGIFVVWEDTRNNGSIYFTNSTTGEVGSWLTPNVRVDQGPINTQQGNPSIALDENNIYVTWEDNRNDDSDIYFANSTDNGKSWVEKGPINNDSFGNRNTAPQIAIDENENIYIVWQDDRNSNMNIYFAKSNDKGEQWSNPNIKVNDANWYCYDPFIAADNKGIYIVWADTRSGNASIYFSNSTSGENGSWLTPNVRVDDAIGICSMYGPSIAVGNNAFYVVWADTREGNRDIYFTKSPTGENNSWQSPNVNVDGHGSTAFIQHNPSLTIDIAGNLYVVWEDFRNGNSDIYFSKSTDRGNNWSQNIPINDSGAGSSNQYSPSIAVNSSGTIYIVWTDYRYGNPDILFAKSTNGGTSFSNNICIHDDPTDSDQMYPSIAIDNNNNIYVVWADKRNSNWDIYFTKSVDDGLTWGDGIMDNNNDIRVDDDMGMKSQTKPAIAVDRTGLNIYVIWEDFRNDNWDIYFSKSTNSGIFFGDGLLNNNDIRVDDDTSNTSQSNSKLSIDDDENIYVVWQDYRIDGNWSIYFSKSIDGGITFGDGLLNNNDIRVDDDPQGKGQYKPGITVDKSGTYIYVTWQDYRNDDYDIYFSKSIDGGSSFGDGILNNNDIRVNDDLMNKSQANPSIVVDKNENIYIVWQDNRNGGQWDIYSTKSINQPLVVNFSISASTVYRTNTIYLFVNGSDKEDEEDELTPHFEYRDPNWSLWNTSYFSASVEYVGNSPTGFWIIEFTPPLNAPLGLYDFRIRFNDSEGCYSEWNESIDYLEVLNNPPVPIDINCSEKLIWCWGTIYLFANATDLESDSEKKDLTPLFAYQYNESSPSGVWSTFFFGDVEYVGSDMGFDGYWKIEFTPNLDGHYDFRVGFKDSDGNYSREPPYVYLYHALNVVHFQPIFVNITFSESNVKRGHTIYLNVDTTNYNGNENELTPHFEWLGPDNEWHNGTYLSEPYYVGNPNSGFWKINFTPSMTAQIGSYDFRVRFNNSYGYYSDWFSTHELVIVQNNPPLIIDLSVPSICLRNQSVHITANCTDIEDSINDLVPEFEYRDPISGIWINDQKTSTYLNNLRFDNGYWVINFTPSIIAVLGQYDFRVSFKDTDDNYSGFLYKNNSLKVLNNKPIPMNLNISTQTILRTRSIIAYANCNDIEDEEALIIPYFEYKKYNKTSWDNDNLGLPIYNNRWEISIDIPIDEELGLYDIRIKFKDTDNSYSSWLYLNNSFEIINNIPNVTIILPLNGSTYKIGEQIYFSLLASDVETASLTFLWDLGDGTTNSQTNFNYTYKKSSVYNINIVVMDNDGGINTSQIIIKIKNNQPSSPSFPIWFLFLIPIVVIILVIMVLLGKTKKKTERLSSDQNNVSLIDPIIESPEVIPEVPNKIKCLKCNTIFNIDNREKNVKIQCPQCGNTGTFK